MRRLATSTANGLAGIVVSGGSDGSCATVACTVTVNLAYNPQTMRLPVVVGNNFSITGTDTALDTCGMGGGAQSPYSITAVTSSSYSAEGVVCSGLTTGAYTGVHMRCGPAATPDDTIGGSQDCAVSSLMALNNNAWWTQMLSYMTSNYLASPSSYKTTFDGGSITPSEDIHAKYAMAAIRFLVDRSNSLWLNEIIYSLNHPYRVGGVGYVVNSASFVLISDWDYDYTTDVEGLAVEYAVAAHAPEGAYWAASEQAAFLNQFYADVDDPTVPPCTTTNQDAANTSTHNWVLSSGLVASGTNDSTHVQLPSSDAHYANPAYYNGTVVQLDNNYNGGSDYSHYTYGLVSGSSGSTGVLTVTAWVDPSGGSGIAPAVNQVVAATYNSGLSVTGTTGQYVCVYTTGNAYILFPLSGNNTISTASNAGIILAPGLQPSGAPTTATPYQTCSTVASVSGTANITATLGTKYSIFDTFTISTAASGATATVTFTKSIPGSFLNPGDEVVAYNGWPNETYFPRWGSYVSSCSGSSCTVINGDGVTASMTTPQMAWRLPQYSNGDCGYLWASKHQQNASIGVQAAVYGYGGGQQTPLLSSSGIYSIGDSGANGGNGGSPGAAFMALDLAAASDDSRAIRDLARAQSWAFDYACRPLLDFSTGRLRDGPWYSMDADQPSCELFEWLLYQSVPGFPMWFGTWAQNISLWKMYEVLPQAFSIPYLAGWAGQIGAGYGGMGLYGNSAVSYGWAFEPSSFFAPASSNIAWYRNLMETFPGSGLWGNTEPNRQAIAVLHNDPRIADSSYTTPPLQAAFTESSSSQVTALTGWPHLYRGDAAVSRTCWQCASGTLTIFDSASFSNGVYDSPRTGQVSIWKNGCLLGGDSNPCNSLWVSDVSTVSDTLQLGGPGLGQFQDGIYPNIALTPIRGWASANAGAYGSMFGDSQSRYAAACTSEAPNYNQAALNIILDHAVRCWVHLKKPGNDEWIFQFDDVALAGGSPVSAVSMNWHLQYPQNGQTQAPNTINYPTGSTVCTALSGTTCTSNTIKEVEDGNGGRTYGLMTWVTSPNAITVKDDCVGLGAGQCAPGSTYLGGNGYTHRFTVAGGTSAGANVSRLISVAGHKLMNGLNDTTFNTVSLNPDANWTGVQLTGAKSTGVVLFAVGGELQTSMTSFMTSFSGTGDWLIMGLSPGTYSITIAGVPVSGSPFTVGPGDGSVYFSSGAGTVVLSTGPTPTVSSTSVQGQVSASGTVAIR